MFKKWRKVVLEEHWEDNCPETSRVNGIEEAKELTWGVEQDNLITNYVCTDVRGGEKDNLITNYVSTGVRGVEEGNNYVSSDESGY